jgi:quercetin dioxygenase-like cupin family protein
MMNALKPFALALALSMVAGAAGAQQAAPHPHLTTRMSKPLPANTRKEATMLMVEYPPGSVDPVHRHNADAFVYVLEGSIVMGLRGGKPVTLTPGQTFYEGPHDVHTIGRNASSTKPARFVVLLLKDKGAPVLVPAK